MRQGLIASLLFLLPCLLLLNGIWAAILLPLVVLAFALMTPKPAWKTLWKNHAKFLLLGAAFLFWPIASIFWAIDALTAMSSFSSLLGVALLAWLGAGLIHSSDANAHLYAIKSLGFGALLAALGFVVIALIAQNSQYFHKFYQLTANRGLAVWAVLVWPLFLVLWQQSQKYLASSIILSVLAAMLLSESLSASLGIVAAMIMFAIMFFGPRYTRICLMLALPALLYLWPVGFIHEMTPEHKQWVAESSIPLSAKHRVYIWDFALDAWQKKPWIGIGMNNARHLTGVENLSSLGLVNLPNHPHNNVIQILLELGIVGFSLYLLAWFFALRGSLSLSLSPMSQATVAAVFITYAAIGMTGFNMWQSWWISTAALSYIFMKLAIKPKNV